MTSDFKQMHYRVSRTIRPHKPKEFAKTREYTPETCRKKCLRLLEKFGPYEPGVIANDNDAQISQLTHLFDTDGTIRSQMAASEIAQAFGIQLEKFDYSKDSPNDVVEWVKRQLATQGRLLEPKQKHALDDGTNNRTSSFEL